MTRVHIALAVADLEASVCFYEALLGRPPARRLPGYAQFLADEPAINLALTQAPSQRLPQVQGAQGPAAMAAGAPANHHFGIEVADTAAVEAARARVEARGIAVLREEDVVCCHSRQDKFWATDPDGHRREVFTVAERYRSLDEEAAARAARGRSGCCAADAACC